jgi:LruC domain-containing protein
LPHFNSTSSYSGTLAFEDLWPSTGDYDFNDLVVDYDFKIKNNQEFVKSITATFVLKAYGASSHNGFGFTLPTLKTNVIC